MYVSISPTGQPVDVPEDASEDVQSFSTSNIQEAFDYFRTEGFVVIRNVIPAVSCQKVNTSFQSLIVPFKGLLPRIGGQEDVNRFNEYGFLMNPLMSIQKKVLSGVSDYIDDALSVLTHDTLRAALELHFGGPMGMMTWNHFVANQNTRPHCDMHFWAPDMKQGEVIGVWTALEDIAAGAGRLYVYPRSHLMDINSRLSQIATTSSDKTTLDVMQPQYVEAMCALIEEQGWSCRAPALKAGDIILWDSRTIHGSLPTDTPQFSRSSFTSHFCALNGRFIGGRAKKTLRNNVSVEFPRRSISNGLRRLFS